MIRFKSSGKFRGNNNNNNSFWSKKMLERIFTSIWSFGAGLWFWAFPPAEPEIEMFFSTKPVKKYIVPLEACYSPPLRKRKIRELPPLHPKRRKQQQHLFITDDYLMRL